MRKNRILRCAFALLCCVSMIVGSVGYIGQTVQAAESLPTDFEYVTPLQFGIEDGTYDTEKKSTTVSLESMNRVLLEADIIYPGTGGFHYLYDGQGTDNTIKFNYLGGEIRVWNSLTSSVWIDGQEISNASFVPLYADVAIEGMTSFENVQFRLSITTEYVDYDQNGSEDDVKMGVWFDGKLYNETYFYFKDCASSCEPYLRVNQLTVASPAPELPTDYTYVTPLDFGIVYDTYAGKDATTGLAGETRHSVSPLTSMDEVLFETKITFGTSAKLYYTQLSDSEWNGLSFAMNSDGTLWFNNSLIGDYVYVDGNAYISAGLACYKFEPNVAVDETTTSFLDLPFKLSITTEFVAYDDTTPNDMKLGVWFNDVLYDNQYIYIKDCLDVCEQGLFLYRPGEGSISLESPVATDREETNERYNLSDGPYLISGTGKILVNDVEVQNGATLTEPGNYRIVSGNGAFVRNVELYDAGQKSSSLTHEELVMPIAGFHGPISGTDANGEEYNFVTEETYALFEEAGINLINYIPKSWSLMSNRKEIIQNLTYAEEHGIGLYVVDGRLKDTDLSATAIAECIAPYSQYHSFKGIFIADEPGTAEYMPTSSVLLEDCAARSKAINGYCNLNGYINLLPLPMVVESDADVEAYADYVSDYITEASPKMLSYDRYVFTNLGMSTYFTNLSIARDAGIPFWTYVQAGNWVENQEIRPSGTPTEGQFLWNVNTCLAYGAKGIQYYPLIEPYDADYTYERYGILDVNGEPTDWYDYAKKANRHIAAIDEILLQAESEAVLAMGTKAQSTTGITTSSYGNLESVILGNEEEGAIIGAFSYNEKDAFYVVNYDMVNSQTITLDFAGTDQYEYRMIQDAVTSYGAGNTCTLTIPAGEAVLVVLEDYVTSCDGMQCLTPIDFGFSYKEYEGTTDGTAKETKGSCARISSMDKILMKTNITFGESTELRYMKSSDTADGHWSGLTFALSADGTKIHFRNMLTGENVLVKGSEYIAAGANNYKFESVTALGEDVTSFLNVPFNLTLTSEYVDYDNNGGENDLKLGVYFNDKLYDDAYIYIKDCTSVCMSNFFLYRPGTGSITLNSPMIFGMEMQPEITDSIAMKFVATLDRELLKNETPYMTFEMNGKVLEDVIGTPKEAGGSEYIFTYPDVMAQNLADNVTATIKTESSVKIYECSMMEYCTEILQAETLTDCDGTLYSEKQVSALKELVVDLVQYATEVQRYRGYENETDWFTTMLETTVPDFATLYDQSDDELAELGNLTAVENKLVGTNDGSYKWMSVGLVLGNKTKIRAHFTANDVSNLSVVATIDGVAQEITFKDSEETGIYSVDFSDIRAYEYEKEVTIQFYEDDTAVGAELHYSVNTYLKEMCSYEEVKTLLLAVHNYGTAADSYMSFR